MKVILIDDDKAMHLIMTRMLGKIDEVDIVGVFQDTHTAFLYLTDNRADVAFVDIHMPRENGLEFASRLRDTGSSLRIVFVTSHKEYALPAFGVYAFDYIVKPISQDRLQETVRRVLSENRDKNEVNNNKSVSPSLIESLTKREIDILQLMNKGMSNREIGVTLKLTEGTIKGHASNIFSKLEVKNRVQAITIAKEFELIN